MGWLGSRLDKLQEGPEGEEIRALTNQFYVTLRAYMAKVEAGTAPAIPQAMERIKQILDKPAAKWSFRDAYDVEQLLVHLFDDHTVKTELRRRMVQAHGVLNPKVAAWYEDEATKSTTPTDERSLLARLVNDMQWRATIEEAERELVKEITNRTGLLFFMAIASFFVVAVMGGLVNRARGVTEDFGLTPGQDDMHIYLFALTAGVWGAAFSMLVSLKKRLEESDFNDLKVMRSRALLLARLLIGGGAGLILYFFLQSKLLGGNLFPPLDGATRITLEQLAQLVVWCFVAGFLEKLVPSLLSKAGKIVEARMPPATPPPRAVPTVEPPAAAPQQETKPKPKPAGPAGPAPATP